MSLSSCPLTILAACSDVTLPDKVQEVGRLIRMLSEEEVSAELCGNDKTRTEMIRSGTETRRMLRKAL